MVTGNMTPAQKASAEDLAEWFDMYEQAMRTANALDFDDLLGYTTAVLRHDVELRERLRRRWRHVLVDEFQDTNSPQYEIVKLLAGIDQDTLNTSEINNNNSSSSSSHVFVVGDTDQAIYGWRGADVRNMRTLFQTDFPTGEVYRLRDNYRSTPGIITAAEAVISRNGDGDRAGLRAHRPQGPPIRIRCLQDAFEEAESVARDIATLIRSNTCKDRDIAVLFRTHMQARFIEQQLVKNSIPYVLVGGVSFWRRVEIQDILAYVRLAISLDDEVALKRVLNVPKRGIGEVSIAKLEAAGVESEGGSLCRLLWPSEDTLIQRIDGIEPLQVVKKVLSAKTAATVEQFRSTLLQMREALATQPLSVALQRIIELAEYKEHVNKGGCGTKEDDDDIQDRLLRLRQLVAAAAEFRPGTAAGAAALDAAFAAIDLEEDEKIDQRISQLLNEKSGKDSTLEKKLFSAAAKVEMVVEVEAMEEVTAVGNNNGDQNLSECSSKSSTESSEELLATARAFLDEAALYSGADEGADVDGIRLMTMHAAKGLEFEVVFVPGCVEGLVPLFNPERGDTVDDLEEETRLFFVSMTRAKSDLRLSYTRVNALQGPQNRRPNIPSRYLQDVVKSGHAVVEEENSMMMGAARSRKHYDFKNNNSTGKSSGFNENSGGGGKSGGGARPRGARTTGRVSAPVASSEWGSDSDWIADEDIIVEDPFIAEEVPLRPAQIRALKRAGRR
jgi:DNA helicase-2/ATP-dependent DNA helicase PcrA